MNDIHIVDPHTAQDLCRELISELPEWFGIPEANARYIQGCSERPSLALKIDNQYVGMIVLEFPFPNNANIYWMAVKKTYHRKNFGFQLMQSAQEHCLNKGCYSLTVETLSKTHHDPNYLKTYHFYEKCGFKPLFELHPYGPDLTMCYMHKTISNVSKSELFVDTEQSFEMVIDFNPSKEDDEFVQDKLFQYETTKLIKEIPEHFSIFIKTTNKELLGGALVWVHRDSIYVFTLWIDERLRNKGYGSKLLKMAEEEGRKQGCRYATVDTHYQGGLFYLKNGYTKLGEIKNYIFEHSKLFYRKEL